MKRRLFIIAICLLLGAVVNICVAWVRVVLAKSPIPLSLIDEDADWPRDVPDHWPPCCHIHEGSALALHVYGSHAIGDIAPVSEGAMQGGSRATVYFIYVYRVGWPLYTLQWEHSGEGVLTTTGSIDFASWLVLVGNVPPAFILRAGRRFPIRPTTWLAIATNTLFYATLLWLLLYGPFALRRLLRLRRGLCPKCAYPMGESAVCTECGVALPRRRMADPT